MLLPKIAFTYSKKNTVIAQRFVDLFHQLNLNIFTSQDLDKSATKLIDKLSILYHSNTYIILISKSLGREEEAYLELMKQKYFNEPNIRIVPIIIDNSVTNVSIPNDIQLLYLEKGKYQECAQTAKKMLSKKLISLEMKFNLPLLYPMLINDIKILGIK